MQMSSFIVRFAHDRRCRPRGRKRERGKKKKQQKQKKSNNQKKRKQKKTKPKGSLTPAGSKRNPVKKKRNNKPATNTAVDSFFISTHKKKPNHQEMAAIKWRSVYWNRIKIVSNTHTHTHTHAERRRHICCLKLRFSFVFELRSETPHVQRKKKSTRPC